MIVDSSMTDEGMYLGSDLSKPKVASEICNRRQLT